MSNKLGSWDPVFIANEALMRLENVLGMAPRVHRGYDKNAKQKGSIVEIKKPAEFEAKDAPGSDSQDLDTDMIQVKLDQWKEVVYGLNDAELSYTQDQIIEDHINPAMYAIANHIDNVLTDLYKYIPWYYGVAGTTPAAIEDITGVHEVLFNNKVPMDNPNLLHLMIDGKAQAKFLSIPAFHTQQGAGAAGTNTQENGTIGRKFGFNIFANQNTKKHAKGTASTGALLANGAFAKGVETVNLDAAAVTGTLKPGDSLVFASHSQRYVVTNAVTAAGNAFGSVGIFPKLAAQVADNETVTVQLHDGTRNLAFHRNFAALAMAPLSMMGDGRGAEMHVAQDPRTGLTIRVTIWYDAKNSKNYIRFDVLYGVKVLNPNLAALLLG
ncbi:MAG TPA: P22 phage major capsid protein family protein [Pyrinomonadaceae bacterium]|jgi:hypothetical protein